jgi:hypothetical protein
MTDKLKNDWDTSHNNKPYILEETVTLIKQPPKPVGWWQITPDVGGGWNTRFAVYAHLDPKHIKNTEELLGWKYIKESE